MPSYDVTEIIKKWQVLDWLVVDLEHSSISLDQARKYY